jgi:6-pyruvoyltetrahydropterin/6-carboxytetrahydropterin synthase
MIRQNIIDKVDHKNLNLDVDFMLGKMASTEILAMEFWKILAPLIEESSSTAHLHSIKLYETPRNYVEYFGE